MNRDQALLLAYFALVVALTLVHDPLLLGGGLLLVLLASGREAPRILGRALRMVLLFSATVSIAYGIANWVAGQESLETLARLNLRVLAITSATFLLMERVSLFRALAFSPGLGYLLGLAYSQSLTLRRAHDDFRLALQSRSIERPRLRDRYRASAAAASWLLEKGLHCARETALALRSRGFL